MRQQQESYYVFVHDDNAGHWLGYQHIIADKHIICHDSMGLLDVTTDEELDVAHANPAHDLAGQYALVNFLREGENLVSIYPHFIFKQT